MEGYGFVVMRLGHLKSAGGRRESTDMYIGYFGDEPVGSPPWQTLDALREDMLRAGAGFPDAGKEKGIPVETRHPYKPKEYMMAKKFGDGEMDLLMGSLNENDAGLTFYRRETEKEVVVTRPVPPTSS